MLRHSAVTAEPIAGPARRVHPSATPSRFRILAPCVLLMAVVGTVVPRHAGAQGTRFLRQPDVSETHIVFVHANDLWLAGRDGGDAMRLTSSEGAETDPAFSEDGQWIAFSGQYGGNTDVYLMPATGGQPDAAHLASGGRCRAGVDSGRRHPLPVGPGRGAHAALEVLRGAAGGWTAVEPLALPQAYLGGMSADGAYLAYQEIGYWDPEWRNYRGGQAQPIGIVSTADWERTTPSWEGERQMDPVWMDGAVYYMSERDWASNVWSFDPRTGTERQLTRHADFDVKSLGTGDGVVVYEQAGYLHELDPAAGGSRRLEINVAGDMNWSRRALGGGALRATSRRAPLPHRQAGALRVARRGLQRARGRGLVAQPHAHPGGGRPASGVVSRRLAHRVVQRRGRRVRARDRGAGRVEPTPR